MNERYAEMDRAANQYEPDPDSEFCRMYHPKFRQKAAATNDNAAPRPVPDMRCEKEVKTMTDPRIDLPEMPQDDPYGMDFNDDVLTAEEREELAAESEEENAKR